MLEFFCSINVGGARFGLFFGAEYAASFFSLSLYSFFYARVCSIWNPSSSSSLVTTPDVFSSSLFGTDGIGAATGFFFYPSNPYPSFCFNVGKSKSSWASTPPGKSSSIFRATGFFGCELWFLGFTPSCFSFKIASRLAASSFFVYCYLKNSSADINSSFALPPLFFFPMIIIYYL